MRSQSLEFWGGLSEASQAAAVGLANSLRLKGMGSGREESEMGGAGEIANRMDLKQQSQDMFALPGH